MTAIAAAIDQHPVFRPLRHLLSIGEGRTAYYRHLLAEGDEHLTAGAWAEIILAGGAEERDWPQIIEQSRHGHVRQLAFDYFELLFEHERAREVALRGRSEPEDHRRSTMVARLDFDLLAKANAEASSFFTTGSVAHLVRAAATFEEAEGWAASLPWCVRAFALAPFGIDYAGTIVLVLVQAAQPEMLEAFDRLLKAADLHPELSLIIGAALPHLRGDSANALPALDALDLTSLEDNPALRPLGWQIQVLRADAHDRAGGYRASYDIYSAANARGRDNRINPALHYESLRARKALRIPSLPPDIRHDVYQMLGFPRSGTTLLENALSQHKGVETFEEIPSHQAVAATIFRTPDRNALSEASAVDLYERARRKYYGELDTRRKKPAATVLVDKLPIQSGEASFMKRLFPERRYIFSIRHPFDVVLSCFRQQFKPNVSMENFRTIADSIKLYDFTMREWFSVFSLESPEVCYVRYEQLVTEFEPTMNRVFGFLGLEWEDSVRDFASAAENRGYKTPSYQKVRKGLSIGVQTYWRNYGFLFDTFDAEPLRRWARFFDYPVK